ncbi:hypothetical protein ABIF74_011746 [Bradyrhizobium japonicum]
MRLVRQDVRPHQSGPKAALSRIGRASPKREYYVASPEGRRLFNMALGPVALSFVGASGKDDLKRILALKTADSNWPVHWLKERGIGHAETLLADL